MKIKIYNKVLALLAVAVASASCQDFLTQENPNKVLWEDYWETVDDCESTLASVYNAFKDQDIYALLYDNIKTDIAIEGKYTCRKGADSENAYLQTVTDADTFVLNKWSDIYTMIFRCNQLLEGVEIVEGLTSDEDDVEELAIIKAQGYMMRGLGYYFLHQAYNHGSVPIYDYVPVDPEELYQPCSTSEEVLEFYRADFLMALSLGLPASWTSTDDQGKVTSGAANAFLGKSYLIEKDYANARKYLKYVIDADYKLAGVTENMTTAGEFNSESILEVNYTIDYNYEYTSNNSFLYNSYNSWFSRNGGYATTVPPYWLIEQAYIEPVDMLRPENFVEMELETIVYDGDTYKDFAFMRNEERTETIAVGSSSTTQTTYVNRYSHTIDGTETTFYTSTSGGACTADVYKRVITYDSNYKTGQDNQAHITSIVYTDSGANFSEYGANYASQNSGCLNVLTIYTGSDATKYGLDADKYYRRRTYSPRASSSFVLPQDYDLENYFKPAMEAGFTNNQQAYYRKHTNWDIWESEYDPTGNLRSGVNHRLMRLSDVYLMYAEALLEPQFDDSGNVISTDDANIHEALMYINKVRYRAGTYLVGSPFGLNTEYVGSASYGFRTTLRDWWDRTLYLDGSDVPQSAISSGIEAMEHIMYVERTLELQVEGYMTRQIDLRRWNLTKARLKTLSTQYYQVSGGATQYVYWGTTQEDWTAAAFYLYQQRYYDVDLTRMADYQVGAVNFNDTQIYYPIPSSESNANPYIN